MHNIARLCCNLCLQKTLHQHQYVWQGRQYFTLNLVRAQGADRVLLLFFSKKLICQLKFTNLARNLKKVDSCCFLVEEVDTFDPDLVILFNWLGNFISLHGHVIALEKVLSEKRMVQSIDVMPLIWLIALSHDDLMQTTRFYLLPLVITIIIFCPKNFNQVEGLLFNYSRLSVESLLGFVAVINWAQIHSYQLLSRLIAKHKLLRVAIGCIRKDEKPFMHTIHWWDMRFVGNPLLLIHLCNQIHKHIYANGWDEAECCHDNVE